MDSSNNTNTEKLNDMKDKLLVSIKDLRSSIDSARLKMMETYGHKHPYVKRLNSYYPILSKQEEYAKELTKFINQNDFDNTQQMVARINAISEMIRFDAKSLLMMVQTGAKKDIIPDDTVLN